MNILAALVLALSFFAPVMNPYTYWQFGILGLIFPFMIFLNLFFVIFWLFRRKIYALISLVVIVMGWNAFSGIIGLKLPQNSDPDDKAIRVMSYNIRALSKLANYPTKSFAENKEKFTFFMEENKLPHILCIQESTMPNIKFIQSSMAYPYYFRYPGYNSTTAILSVFPIENSGEVKFDKGNGDCVWADINMDNKMVRFYSVHLHSNTISVQADSLIKIDNIEKDKTLKGVEGMFQKYKFATRVRYQQAQKIKKHVDSSPHPVVLCGDFNDTPQSFIYHILSEGMKDTFKERGIGFGTTWAGNLPGLKIDYILADPSVSVISHDIYRRQFSDHYPITTTLLFQ